MEHETLKNFWLNTIDKALFYLGYSKHLIDSITLEQKKSIIIDEYLFRATNADDDILAISLDDMAFYVIECQRK